jgi:hypothetical protein
LRAVPASVAPRQSGSRVLRLQSGLLAAPHNDFDTWALAMLNMNVSAWTGLAILMLLAAMAPALRYGFGISWLWATAPLWIAAILLGIAVGLVLYVIFKAEMDFD